MRLRKQKKVVAVTLATAIAVSTISASASAVQYDLADGDVTIGQDETKGAYSYQGDKDRTYVNEDKMTTARSSSSRTIRKLPPATPSPCKRTSKRPIRMMAPRAAMWIS